jgi:hypothetical protein
MMRNKAFRTFLLTLVSVLTFSKRSEAQVMDALNGENKIYVVVLVLATIFAGIIAFLIYLERKMARLEKKFNQGDE